MMVSVVCPVLNEEAHIDALLEFCRDAEPKEKEIFLMDGGSMDNTVEVVKRYSESGMNIRLLHNPQKYVPFALNMAIPLCKGDFIVRLDAHTRYENDYFEKILQAFGKTGAEIVGGPMRAIGKSNFQWAVSYATSTALGVGNSSFHFEDFEGFAESVYLGAWRREIFEKTGLFDEQLLRNQDDEFHYRARSMGFRIYQDPSIRSLYYPRSNLSSLFKQYYGYGLFKPMVLRKVKSSVKLRHLIPAAFVLYLFAAFFLWLWSAWLYAPLLLYGMLLIVYASRCPGAVFRKLWCLVIYPTLHIAYGIGFLFGIIRLFRAPSSKNAGF